jgi:hypothetical protein
MNGRPSCSELLVIITTEDNYYLIFDCGISYQCLIIIKNSNIICQKERSISDTEIEGRYPSSKIEERFVHKLHRNINFFTFEKYKYYFHL